ncbi:immediate early response 2b [Melanotaenia boesemani]|uniref:immediate early response 2b n=1 Tax=Melanotaenia boesemani TaxID=1250792 RepID=UPI001C041EDB|nr:immediate early response 2b [Melanotaenia boesemani]
MSATTAMDVNEEARRILTVSISKLYASRSQRGGLRLHRSLLLSLVMRSARDIYHSSREVEAPNTAQSASEEPMDTSSSPGEQTREPDHQAEPKTAMNVAETAPEESSNEDAYDCEITEDKENLSPARQSRKRRGKASAAPDFLPIKRARLEPGEERYAAPPSSCRTGAAETLTTLSLNRVIPAF